jgi:hypothetical protein
LYNQVLDPTNAIISDKKKRLCSLMKLILHHEWIVGKQAAKKSSGRIYFVAMFLWMNQNLLVVIHEFMLLLFIIDLFTFKGIPSAVVLFLHGLLGSGKVRKRIK